MQDRHYLTPLFEPRSVAIIGASEREHSIGAVLLRNMLDARYQGQIYAVNPGHKHIFDLRSYASIEEAPGKIDLAVIATQAATVPAIMEACGRAGVPAAVVISAGFAESGESGAALQQAVLQNARRHQVRLLGPNCLGVMRPALGLDATFARGGALPGNIGLVSQSGALCTAILDWARPNGVGFSSVISLGGTSDVDFGEILDYLVADDLTKNIFLYIEGIKHARSFMSALRAAARVKPVLLIKVDRHPDGSRAARSHTGALVGADDVFDAALRRAGVVRLYNLSQMFAAAQALFSQFRPRGNRLCIITNGGGPGVLAADRATDLHIPLAQLSPATLTALNAALPPHWPHGNPIDIIGDADAERYRQTLAACLADENVDGVLVMLAPQAITAASDVARAVIETARDCCKPLIACWMGEAQVREARQLFRDAHIPTFSTPEPAVELFSHISAHYRNQQLLIQAPPALAHATPPRTGNARQIIEAARADSRTLLSEKESKAILAAFDIPVAPVALAQSADEAVILAERIGLPVAMKIDSPQITHKSDCGGVKLNLSSLQAVRSAYLDIIDAVRRHRPDAAINGVAIEPMIFRPTGRELLVGVIRDDVFGPVITFGEGGARVEVHRDRAIALPPLNRFLIADMIGATRVSKLLGEFRGMPPINGAALEMVLLRVSEMVCELPWLREMDINPLVVDERGAVAVDARIIVGDASPAADRHDSRCDFCYDFCYDHMAIHPYPSHLTVDWQLADGTPVIIRPIRPEDATMEQDFVRQLSPESKYFRFMGTLRELNQPLLARLTQIDYDREMALIAVLQKNGQEVEIGVCRYVTLPNAETCEFAIVIADEWSGKGLGKKLMELLITTARAKGLKVMRGDFLVNNMRMIHFAENLGFVIHGHPDDISVRRGVLTL